MRFYSDATMPRGVKAQGSLKVFVSRKTLKLLRHADKVLAR